PGVEGLRPSFFSLLPPMDCSSRLGTQAPASIPRQPRRVAQFTNVGATGQIRSRTDPPHCTSRHHFDVARATRLAPAVRPGEPLPDQRAPEPLVASAPSP